MPLHLHHLAVEEEDAMEGDTDADTTIPRLMETGGTKIKKTV